jgi:hypothetical protein
MSSSIRLNFLNPFFDESPLEYDWISERNQWVLEGIHDNLLTSFSFPIEGKQLLKGGPIPDGDFIKREDLEAYAIAYPQNARFYIDAGVGRLELLTPQQSKNKILEIAQDIKDRDPEGTGITKNLTSRTTLASKHPDVQVPDPNITNFTPEQIASRLVNMGIKLSSSKLRFLRTIFGNPLASSLNHTEEGVEIKEGYFSSTTQVIAADLYDWKNNIIPGSPTELCYFNPDDQKYYYVRRTNNRNAGAYDVGSGTDTFIQNKSQALHRGSTQILKYIGKYSEDSLDDLLNRPDKISFMSYIDERPQSQWMYAIIVDKKTLEDLFSGAFGTSSRDNQSVFDVMKILKNTQKVTSSNKVYFDAPHLDHVINNTIKLLKYYRSAMTTSMITPVMVGGFDIQNSIAQVETFLPSFDDFLTFNGIKFDKETNSRDSVEFCFNEDYQVQYIVVNGNLYTEPIGSYCFFEKPLSEPLPDGVSQNLNIPNVFYLCSPRSYKFVADSHYLSAESRKDPSKKMPWSEFVKQYVFPEVKIIPAEEQEKIRKREGMLQFEALKNKNIFEALNEKNAFNEMSAADLNREFFNRKSLMQNLTTQLQKATDGCDSSASKLTKSVTQLMPLLKKQDYVNLTRQVVLQIRDELVKEQQTKDAITNIDTLTNPAASAAIANRWIDEQIDCLLEQIGKITEDVLLPPDADPGDGKMLLKTVGNNFPLKFSINTSRPMQPIQNASSPELWKLWLKAVRELFKKFLNQLILSILQDILKAALGCGPGMDKPLDRRPALYGLSNINRKLYLFLEEPGPEATLAQRSHYARLVASGRSYDKVVINVIPVAKNVGFANREVTIDDNGVVNSREIPITHEQIIALNYDVSRMVTPQELKNLLNGDASEYLVAALVEMINRGAIDASGLSPSQLRNPIILTSRQESFESGDERYAVLGINEKNLAEYFFEIGKLLSQKEIDELTSVPEQTPEEAYCETDPTPRSDITTDQIMADLDFSIVAKTKKIQDMCEMINVGNPWNGLMDDFWLSLEPPETYTKFLDTMAEFINYVMELLGSYLADMFPETPAQKTRPLFANTVVGKDFLLRLPHSYRQSYYPYAVMVPNADLGPRLMFTTPIYRDDVAALGLDRENAWDDQEAEYVTLGEHRSERVWCVIEKDTAFYYKTPKRLQSTQGPDKEEYLIASSQLSDSNANLPQYRNLTLKGLYAERRVFSEDPEALPRKNVDLAIVLNELLRTTAADEDREIRNLVSNRVPSTYGLVQSFYYSEIGKSRLKVFGPAIANNFLVRNDCINTGDEFVASAVCESLWSRLRKFLINVGPLFSAYNNLLIPDFVDVVSDYLYRKYKKEFEESGIWGISLMNLEGVGKYYDTLGGQKVEDLLNEKETLDERFKELIKQSLLGAMKILMDKRSYSIGENPFEFTRSKRFEPYADKLYDHIQDSEDVSDITYSKTSNTWRRASQYLTPIPHILALEYIAFDSVANIISRFPNLQFRYDENIYTSDDRLLSFARGYNSFEQMKRLNTVFPVTVGDKLYWNQEEMEIDLETYRSVLEISDLYMEYRQSVEPFIQQARNAIVNDEGTGAENIVEEELSGIRNALAYVESYYDMYNPYIIPMETLRLSWAHGDTGRETAEGGASSQKWADDHAAYRASGDYSQSGYVRVTITAKANRSIFSLNRLNPVTLQLYLRLVTRPDVGPDDDPDHPDKFFELVEASNKKVNEASGALGKTATFFVETEIKRKELFERALYRRQDYNPPLFPFNLFKFVGDNLSSQLVDTEDGVGEFPHPTEYGTLWTTTPHEFSGKAVLRVDIEKAVNTLEQAIEQL